MKEKKLNLNKFVVCIRNTDYTASLELYKIYQVLPDEDATEDGDLRIIDESGEDYLYPADFFIPIEVPLEVESALTQVS
jgi:hypothetical protein